MNRVRSISFFKYVNRVILMCLILMMTLGLYGCSTKKVDVSTVMTINSDGSGNRQITMNLKKEDFQKMFPGISWESMIETVTEKCPKEFGFLHSDLEEAYQYTFQLDFESIEDYQKKVQKIIGDVAVVRYEQPQSVFASGMYFEENFTSLAFLNWLFELVEEKGNMQSGSGEALFKVGEVILVDNEKTVKLGPDPIRYDMRIVNPVERIDILTHYLENKSSDRQVIITFNRESAEKNRAQLESWFTRQLPQGVTGDWQSAEDPVFVISGSHMSAASMDSLMQSVLSERDSFVSIRPQPKSKLFDSIFNWEERINLQALTNSEEDKIMLGYYVQGEDGMKISVKHQNADKNIKLENSDRYAGYQKVLESELREVNLVTSVTASYVVNRVGVETKLEDKKTISRNIDLFFQVEPDAEDMEHIFAGISKKAEGYAKVSKKVNEDGSFIAIRIAQTGNVDTLNEGFTQIFNVQGQLQHTVSGKLIDWKHTGIFKDTVDFTKFVENDPAQTQLVYRLTYPSGSRINAESVSSNAGLDKETIVKNEYQAEMDGGAYLSLSMASTIPNKKGRMLLGILIAAAILIPIIIIVVKAVRRMTKRTVGKVTTAFKNFNNSFGPNDQAVLGYDDMKDENAARQPGAEKKAGVGNGAGNRIDGRSESGAGNRADARNESGVGNPTGAGNKSEAEKWIDANKKSDSGKWFVKKKQPDQESGNETDKTAAKNQKKKLAGKDRLKALFAKKKAPEVAYEEQKFEADSIDADGENSIYKRADDENMQMPEAEGFSEIVPSSEDTEGKSAGYVSFEDWKEKGKNINVYDMNYSSAPWRSKNSSVETLDGSINETVDSSEDDL